MKLNKITTEHLFYGLALFLAAAVRWIGLGVPALSETEAGWAMQALHAARGETVLLGAQPGYLTLTAATFFLAGSSEFLARFWPALAGTLLAISPYFLRERLGRGAGLVLAFALAFEPSLVAASRQADGRMLAIAGATFAVIFFLRGKFSFAGIASGLAILGGPSVWTGGLALTFGLTLGWLIDLRRGEHLELDRPFGPLLGWAAGTIFLVGSLFGFLPGGLSALANSLVTWLQGWGNPESVTITTMLTGGIVLSPLAFLFGAVAVVRVLWRGEYLDWKLFWIWLSLWVVTLIYPERRLVDLAWVVVPGLMLVARLAVHLSVSRELRIAALGYAFLVAVLAVSIWINLSGYSFAMILDDEVARTNAVRMTATVGAILLILISFGLIAFGWGPRLAGTGLVYGLCVALLLYTLATDRAAAGLGRQPGMELWVDGAYPVEQGLFEKILEDMGENNTGDRHLLNLVVSGMDLPSLRWALRNERGVSFVSQLAPDTHNSLILTPETQNVDLGLAVSYTGQPLIWSQAIDWPALLSQDQASWFFYRELPYRPDIMKRQNLIVWLRSDLFPGAAR